jgi:hypothetical protein
MPSSSSTSSASPIASVLFVCVHNAGHPARAGRNAAGRSERDGAEEASRRSRRHGQAAHADGRNVGAANVHLRVVPFHAGSIKGYSQVSSASCGFRRRGLARSPNLLPSMPMAAPGICTWTNEGGNPLRRCVRRHLAHGAQRDKQPRSSLARGRELCLT